MNTPQNEYEYQTRPTRVKICGITNLEDAVVAIKAGADELGFNFYLESPRYIFPLRAREIIDQLPISILKVGVFVNETIETIAAIAVIADLDLIQLHGDEDSAFVADLKARAELPVIKAFRVTPDFLPESVLNCQADAILLDGYSSKERGGTGDIVDWNVAQRVSDIVQVLYLAGGLSSDNVAEAINKVRPYAVDVCSRIESEPGKKDADKLKRFIAAAKETI